MENGDNHGVVYENVAWQYHTWGAGAEDADSVYPSGFTPGKASFATLKFHIKEANGSVTEEDQGVYNSIEQGKKPLEAVLFFFSS
jgi:hypothetical protein